MNTPRNVAASASPTSTRWFSIPAMLCPDAYVWMIFLATLDVILTALVLSFGGDVNGASAEEINPIARLIIDHWQMAGAMAFKFALVLLAIVLCEIVARRRPAVGKRLAWTCVLLSAVPVVWSLALLVTNRVAFFGA